MAEGQEIKIEPQEQIILQHYSYPLQAVKIEVDPLTFPPVKWYPLDPSKSMPQQKVTEIINDEQTQMKKFVDILTLALFQVLTPKQTDKFRNNYSEFKGQRVYILIALSFAKWRSESRIADFQRILAQQLTSNNIAPLNSLPPFSLLYKTMKACQLYLQGDYQQAVDSLYSGSEKSMYMNAISFAEILQKQIKNDQIPKPEFQSSSQSSGQNASENDSECIDQDDEGLQQEMEEQEENLNGQVMGLNGSNNTANGHFYSYPEPFLISDMKNPMNSYLFPSDQTIKFKKHFTDLVRK